MTSAVVRADGKERRGVGFPCARRVALRWSFRRSCCTGGVCRSLGLSGSPAEGRHLTSADRPQLAQVAVTARTPFWRMLASNMGGPGLERMSGRPIATLRIDRRPAD